MSTHPPMIGEWYSLRGGELFEVVAVDEASSSVDVQYYDGTLEEIELDDWYAQCGAREIEEAEPPEDWTGSVDVDTEADVSRSGNVGGIDDDRRLNAMGPDDTDLFD